MTLKHMILGGDGYGLALETEQAKLEAGAAHTKGDLVQLDETAVNSDSRFYKTKAVAEEDDGIYGIVQSTCATGDDVWVTFVGSLDANCEGTSAIAIGDSLAASTGNDYMNEATVGDKVIGKAREVLASGESIIAVDFDGVRGFGKL